MSFTNPIARLTKQARFYESSALRSPRDSDSVTRAHIKTATTGRQLEKTMQAVEQIQRQLNRLRRKGQGDIGKPAEAGTGGMEYKGEWSAALSYTAQQVVTRGALGEFICVQDVSGADIGTEPETGAPFWHSWVNPPPGVWA